MAHAKIKFLTLIALSSSLMTAMEPIIIDDSSSDSDTEEDPYAYKWENSMPRVKNFQNKFGVNCKTPEQAKHEMNITKYIVWLYNRKQNKSFDISTSKDELTKELNEKTKKDIQENFNNMMFGRWKQGELTAIIVLKQNPALQKTQTNVYNLLDCFYMELRTSTVENLRKFGEKTFTIEQNSLVTGPGEFHTSSPMQI